MRIAKLISELDHPVGVTTGCVLTLGALHEGHLELMRVARRENDRVVATVFVNPTQFGPNEDFSRYPRDLERDAALAEQVGVDVLFAPDVAEMYPRSSSSIQVPVVTSLWEGAARPGHFEGVATVVCKLLNIVRCDVTYFGQKDLQQCLVVNRMIEDLNLPVRFSRQPTVREADGLAMSSRNRYLSQEERVIAPVLYAHLSRCRDTIHEQRLTEEGIDQLLAESKSSLSAIGFRVDYFDMIDLETASPVRNTLAPSAIITAARLGNTRLIDNILM